MGWTRFYSRLEQPVGETSRWWLAFVGFCYLVSSFVTGPLAPERTQDGWFLRVGPIYLGRPVVTSGDSPHYLALVNSLVEDLDFDLANNYRRAEAGSWDLGARLRGVPIDHHVDVDRQGRELLCHPPFLPMLMAAVVWPLRGTQWVESACIWLSLAAVLGAMYLLARLRPRMPVAGLLLLGLATPLWCYARDLWAETWMTVAWVVMLAAASPALAAVAAVCGIWFKYSFAVVPAVMAGLAFWRGERRRGLWLAGATALGVGGGIAFAQYLFRDVGHFSLFHSGIHVFSGDRVLVVGPFGATRTALPGLLLDPENGLLCFAPFLAWGLWPLLRRGGELYLPALAFFLLHCTYLGWRAGTGFSARYLVPMLPVLVLAVMDSSRRPRWLFWAAAAWSLVVCGLAGVLPVAALDRTPWEMLSFLLEETRLFLTSR
jgi:hypothetical protein